MPSTVPKAAPIDDKEVFAPTARGTAELRGSRTSLSAEELELLVLVDGRSTVAQIVRSTRSRNAAAVKAALLKLLAADLIARARELASDVIDAGDFFSVTTPLDFSGASAGPEVERGVSTLQEQGYYVRIARPPAEERKAAEETQPPAKGKPVVLIVEDDAHVAKLLQTCFKLEGFTPLVAGNRDEIVAAFRRPAAPQLVLLDVMLPDVDGFEVLGRMRQHPLLKSVPVVMLTGKATREAVLKGLHGGADGYITKPFDVEVLMRAVRTVLGAAAE